MSNLSTLRRRVPEVSDIANTEHSMANTTLSPVSDFWMNTTLQSAMTRTLSRDHEKNIRISCYLYKCHNVFGPRINSLQPFVQWNNPKIFVCAYVHVRKQNAFVSCVIDFIFHKERRNIDGHF